ncbi:MAG: hypothetical protein IPH39_06090 [Sulfuritalea sp.]|nr:hypothetical protein [Sulfuritalea sp.]
MGPPTKSLIGIPWRYAIRCIDDLGLILRAEVIWSKPNGLPESVTDRVRRSHETWFHFTKEPRYFSAVDEIRQPARQTPRLRLDDPDRAAARPRPPRHRPLRRVPDRVAATHHPGVVAAWDLRRVRRRRRTVSVRDPIDPRFLASSNKLNDRGHVALRGVAESSILRTGLQAGQSPPTRITGYACACPAPGNPPHPPDPASSSTHSAAPAQPR